MSPEAPYETRFFTVSLDENGKVIATDTGFIAAVEPADAAEFAKSSAVATNPCIKSL